MGLENLIGYFAPEGIWAVLSLMLIFYIIKGQEKRDLRQDEREQKYQGIISDLSKALQDMNEIKELLGQKLK